MVIWSCSSCLHGFIPRAAWRRHYPLLSPRPPASPPPIHHFSSARRSTKKSAPKAPMGSSIPAAKALIDSSREPFYVIRKGDVIGVYKNLSDCQAQASKSVLHPSVTVYKGYSLRKETEEYLAARGFRNAVCSIGAADASDELFGDLVPCPFQQPDENTQSILKMSQGQEMETRSSEHPKVADLEPLPDSELSCILEFDGACKGNPGKSGAGVIIRRLDGSVIAVLREGLGIMTNNAAEYRALILGLNYASKKGFKYIRCQGDSKLVCNQEFNSDADVQANFGCQLAGIDLAFELLATKQIPDD
ncbi:RNase H family protein [Zea mays]|uniref:RNase H family protein n=1 Tax=Zea mays TaxID=4577 RepID=A0A1D6LIH8_MAIZE|nr:RNase H family protein [Zea mays]